MFAWLFSKWLEWIKVQTPIGLFAWFWCLEIIPRALLQCQSCAYLVLLHSLHLDYKRDQGIIRLSTSSPPEWFESCGWWRWWLCFAFLPSGKVCLDYGMLLGWSSFPLYSSLPLWIWMLSLGRCFSHLHYNVGVLVICRCFCNHCNFFNDEWIRNFPSHFIVLATLNIILTYTSFLFPLFAYRRSFFCSNLFRVVFADLRMCLS